MKKISFLLTVVLLLSMSGCSFYHMQVPRTVPVGKFAGGIGLAGVSVKGAIVGLPGFWARTGIAPNLDLGIHSWGLGLKVDAKYSFNDYIALGGGGSFAFLGVLMYGAEGSVYLGLPVGKTLYPYAVVRLSTIGLSGELLENSFAVAGTSLSGVGGLRLQFGNIFSIYGEAGWNKPIVATSGAESSGNLGSGSPIFGLGVALGY